MNISSPLNDPNKLESQVQSFIAAYYKGLILRNVTMIKFYYENAYIWRNSMKTSMGQPVNKSFLMLPNSKGFQLGITGYNYTPLPNGYTLIVNGISKSKSKVQRFTQVFTINEIQGRQFIMSDYLNYTPTSEEDALEELNKLTFAAQYQSKTNPYGKYVPSNSGPSPSTKPSQETKPAEQEPTKNLDQQKTASQGEIINNQTNSSDSKNQSQSNHKGRSYKTRNSNVYIPPDSNFQSEQTEQTHQEKIIENPTNNTIKPIRQGRKSYK